MWVSFYGETEDGSDQSQWLTVVRLTQAYCQIQAVLVVLASISAVPVLLVLVLALASVVVVVLYSNANDAESMTVRRHHENLVLMKN